MPPTRSTRASSPRPTSPCSTGTAHREFGAGRPWPVKLPSGSRRGLLVPNDVAAHAPARRGTTRCFRRHPRSRTPSAWPPRLRRVVDDRDQLATDHPARLRERAAPLLDRERAEPHEREHFDSRSTTAYSSLSTVQSPGSTRRPGVGRHAGLLRRLASHLHRVDRRPVERPPARRTRTRHRGPSSPSAAEAAFLR